MTEQLVRSKCLVYGYNRKYLHPFNTDISNLCVQFLHKDKLSGEYVYLAVPKLTEAELTCIQGIKDGISRGEFAKTMKKDCDITHGRAIKIWKYIDKNVQQ
eukprot:412260_1